MSEARGGLLSAGGIISIVVGATELIAGGMMLASSLLDMPIFPPGCGLPGGFPSFQHVTSLGVLGESMSIAGIVLAVLGLLAILGGVSAVRRGSYGLSLLGAICALPSGALGVLAIIFVALARGEFGPGPDYD